MVKKKKKIKKTKTLKKTGDGDSVQDTNKGTNGIKERSTASTTQKSSPTKKRNPNLMPPWPKGTSGNPKGMPKGMNTSALRRMDMKRLAEKAPYAKKKCKELGLDPKKHTIGDVLAAIANLKAMEEGTYYKENLNRDEGKVPDKIIGVVDTSPLTEMDDDKLRKIIAAGVPND